MSNHFKIFDKYISLASTLEDLFRDHYDELISGENNSILNFSIKISDFLWVDMNLPVLMEKLLDIPNSLNFEISIHDCFKEKFRVRYSDFRIELEWIDFNPLKENYYGSLPSTATDAYEELLSKIKDRPHWHNFKDIFNILIRLRDGKADIYFQISLQINKNKINDEIKAIAKNDTVICYLFPESLSSILSKISLESFENEIYKHGFRSIFPVFSFSGYLKGDFISICGKDHLDELEKELAGSLPDELLEKANKSLNLRQYHSLGSFPTRCLTPDVFSITINKMSEKHINPAISMLTQLNSFKALLSVLFLANYTNKINNSYKIEFRGRDQVSFPIERDELVKLEKCSNDIYQLYLYAYDGFSVDKLEIAQQFLSLSATDINSLCGRATAIKDATKTAYDNVLIGRVRDYFEARQKIQEIIKTVIAETSNSIISLTKDVSKDLYTIAGVIAIAIIGVLLKPDFDLCRAAFWVSLIVALYMIVIIIYHLNTISSAHDLQITQHKTFIRSFEAILGQKEIEIFLDDKQLKDAIALFSKTLGNAYIIYSLLLIISLTITLICI